MKSVFDMPHVGSRYVGVVWRGTDSTLYLNVASRGTTIIFR